MAIDAVVGSVGGPVFKFAGKALVGTAAALGKGALPAARGLAQLGAAAAREADEPPPDWLPGSFPAMCRRFLLRWAGWSAGTLLSPS
ncbi:hypothetical protein ACFSC4_17975 [Deinococcus malanensis]|uniref:hypothetical protein n=1 Tax=Deinococcus malanensis TaxID=1706855 RepID=UPI0036312ED2